MGHKMFKNPVLYCFEGKTEFEEPEHPVSKILDAKCDLGVKRSKYVENVSKKSKIGIRYVFEPHPGIIFPGGFFGPKNSLRALGILLTGLLWLLRIGFTFKTVQYRIFENFWTHLALLGAFGHAPTPQKTILYDFSAGSSSREKNCENGQNRFLT